MIGVKMLSERDLESFEKGCKAIGEKFERRKRTLVCILNEDEKIVLDNKGRWIKVYDYTDYPYTSALKSWVIPKSIEFDEDHKELTIRLERPEGEKIVVGLYPVFRSIRRPYPSILYPTVLEAPNILLPEFEEIYHLQKLRGILRHYKG